MGTRINNSVLNQTASPAIYASTLGTRPNFGFAGRLFVDTASPYGIYRDTGSAWVLVASPSGAVVPTLQTVTTSGNSTTTTITSTGFIKNGGTSAQFLKADGSVDTNVYVSSVFGRTGVVVAVSGDYTTAQVTESGNLYYTDARARAALSSGTNISYNSTTGVITNGITNNNQLTNGAGYITANQAITLSGDITGSGTTAITTTLSNSGAAAGTYGSTAAIPVITVDAKGRITTITTAALTGTVTSVFGRTGVVVAVSGDYTTAQVTESGNLYYTDARARAALSSGTNISYNSTTGVITNGITNNNQLTNGAGYITANQAITLSGDVTGSGTTAITTTLSNTAVTLGTYGSSTQVAQFTVDAKGRITAASNVSIAAAAVSSVFGRTGAIVATTGDYVTGQVTESSNLYYTDARARAALSGGTNISYNSTTGVITNNITNTNQLTNGSGFLTANQTITLSGDVTGSGSTAITATLAASGVTAGSYGSGTLVPTITVDVKGRVTNVTTTAIGAAPVSSVFGRTGAVVSANGDYNTGQVTESSNLYYTDARARAALSGGTNISYNSTTGVITNGITNTNQLTNGSGFLTANQTITLSGNITGSGSTSIITVISAGSVTTAMLATVNISQFTNDSGYITTSALSGYLPLTGGTMSGSIVMPNGVFYQAKRNSGAISLNVLGFESGTDDLIQVTSNDWKLRNTGSGDAGNILKVTNVGSVTAYGSIEIPNGSFFKARRSSSNLLISLLGIESGTDRTLLTVTGDYVLQNGSAVPLQTTTASGVTTFSSTVTASSLIKSGGTSSQILAADGTVITAGAGITISAGTISASTVTSSGTYTPTATNAQNATSITAYLHRWSRVGNIVTVSGLVEYTTTGTSVVSGIDITLPVATTFTTTLQASGAVSDGASATGGGSISSVTTGSANTVKILLRQPVISTGVTAYYCFQYEIL